MTENYGQLMVLKALGDNQEGTDRYVKAKERSFNKLKQDLEGNRLVKGTSKEKIIALYGEPIVSKPLNNRDNIKESFLYRHPVKFFDSDKLYLYFDERGCLDSWRLEPAASSRMMSLFVVSLRDPEV